MRPLVITGDARRAEASVGSYREVGTAMLKYVLRVRAGQRRGVARPSTVCAVLALALLF